MSTDISKQVKLGSVSGLVPREKSMAFERILFRATRGNVFLKQAVIEDSVTDPVSGEKVNSAILKLLQNLSFNKLFICIVVNIM